MKTIEYNLWGRFLIDIIEDITFSLIIPFQI